MSDGDLPDMFVARAGGLLKTYEIKAYHSPTDDQWMMESTMSAPIVGELVQHAPRPVDEDHVEHVYESYNIARED